MSTPFGFILVRANRVLRNRDAVERHPVLVETRPAAIPLLRIRGPIAFYGTAVQVGIATALSRQVEGEYQLGRMARVVIRRI